MTTMKNQISVVKIKSNLTKKVKNLLQLLITSKLKSFLNTLTLWTKKGINKLLSTIIKNNKSVNCLYFTLISRFLTRTWSFNSWQTTYHARARFKSAQRKLRRKQVAPWRKYERHSMGKIGAYFARTLTRSCDQKKTVLRKTTSKHSIVKC